jgi:hypothetical protein
MEALVVALELGAGGGAFASPKFATGKFGGGGWVNVLEDVRMSEPIVIEYGIFDSDPDKLVADPGSATFAFNNGEWNSTQTLGFYSPLNAIKRGGYDFNIPIRITLSSGGQSSTKHRGRLADINVTPGAKEDRMTRCTSLDVMDDYSRLPVPALETQFDKRGDELIQMVLNSLPTELQPALRTIETGLETYQIAMDRAREESMTIRELIYEIAASEQATAMIIGTSNPEGGLFAFRNRQYAAFNTFVFHTFEDDIARGGLVMPSSRDDIVSKVQVIAYDTRVDVTPVVLYKLNKTSTFIGPGQSIDYLFGGYRDPQNPSTRIGGTEMIDPVPTIDYLMNTSEDGTGADLTLDLTVVADYDGAGGVRYPEIRNNGSVGGYLTHLQARGFGIYREPVTVERNVPDVAYGHRLLQIVMPYQNDTNVASDVASYMTHSLSRVFARVTSITFLANHNAELMSKMLVLEPGHRIAITEEVTGIDAEEFTINGVRIEIQGSARGPLAWCTYYVRPADTQQYWFAGIVGASEAGLTTVPGY